MTGCEFPRWPASTRRFSLNHAPLRLPILIATVVVALVATGCDSGSSAQSGPASADAASGAGPADAAVAATPAADPALMRMLPSGATLRMVVPTDFTRDGTEEVLVAFDPVPDGKTPGTLMVLRREVDGPYRKIIEGKRAILCRTCDGAGGEPLHAVVANYGRFAIQHKGVKPDGGSWFSEATFNAEEQRGIPWGLTSTQDVAYASDRSERASAKRGFEDVRGIDLEAFNATGMIRGPQL